MVNLRNLIVGILVVSVIFLTGCTTDQGSTPLTGRVTSEFENNVVATVNGDEITQEDVSFLKEAFLEQGQELSEEDILEQLVRQRLVLGVARDRGYFPTSEQAEAELQSQLSQQGLTLSRYRERVESQGLSYEGHLNEIKEDIAIQNFLTAYLDENTPEQLNSLINRLEEEALILYR